MSSNSTAALSTHPTRRKMITGIFAVCAAPVMSAAVWGQTKENKMAAIPAIDANKSRTSLHQEIEYKAAAQRIYQVLLSSKDFTTFSGAPAEIDPKAGGTFSMFGGLVVGRNVELIPNQRIVQAWRLSQEFPEGIYSLVKFELSATGPETRIILDHTGFPEGHFDHLDSGWHSHYWEPLRKFLA